MSVVVVSYPVFIWCANRFSVAKLLGGRGQASRSQSRFRCSSLRRTWGWFNVSVAKLSGGRGLIISTKRSQLSTFYWGSILTRTAPFNGKQIVALLIAWNQGTVDTDETAGAVENVQAVDCHGEIQTQTDRQYRHLLDMICLEITTLPSYNFPPYIMITTSETIIQS